MDQPITAALVTMTSGGFGAVTIVDAQQKAVGIFTDGDLRRLIAAEGEGAIHKKLSDLTLHAPHTIEGSELLYVASNLFKEKKVDTLVVTQGGKVSGMIDIQDLV
jgi:arabinose-5-phosphate isomerase